MQLFAAEMVAEIPSASTKRCRCGEMLELVRTMFDENSGKIVHMFECACGERIWDD